MDEGDTRIMRIRSRMVRGVPKVTVSRPRREGETETAWVLSADEAEDVVKHLREAIEVVRRAESMVLS